MTTMGTLAMLTHPPIGSHRVDDDANVREAEKKERYDGNEEDVEDGNVDAEEEIVASGRYTEEDARLCARERFIGRRVR